MAFSDAYAACPVCSPTRASLLTGKYPATVGVTDWIDWSKGTHPAKGKLVDEIEKLKTQDGGDIIAYGGATFVSALIKHQLIDEFYLFINPVAISQGLPIFAELNQPQNLNLVKATAFECGIVVLNYVLKRN